MEEVVKCIAVYEKELCCGCSACEMICPINCIKMDIDEEGFKYPLLDNDKCVECQMCKEACPVQKEKLSIKREAYAAINLNNNIRENSSSGGVFSALAEVILSKDGVVCGCRFDEKFNAVHDIAMNMQEVEKFRGAKYIQSHKGNIYYKVKEFLEKDKYVLFSGTPCEVAGLKTYLGKEYEKLVCCDIVCHGVPSPRLWQEYLEYVERKYSDSIKNIYFRFKEKSWKRYCTKIEFKNSIYEEYYFNNEYMQAFLKDICLRPSCYQCEFKDNNIYSDITLGDYWGIEKAHPEIDDDKGISLIIVNTNKGKSILKEASENLKLIESTMQQACERNKSILVPVSKPEQREIFFQQLDRLKIDYVINQIYEQYIDKKGKN